MQTYFERLDQILDELAIRLRNAEAEVAEQVELNEHIGYEQTYRRSFKLERLKGKATRKFFHVSIYRLSSGNYELTAYIL
jgi:hypothetical protein